MGNRGKQFIASFLIVALCIGTMAACKKDDDMQTENATPFQWNANWIWGDFAEDDSWLMARKVIELDKSDLKEEALLRIASDSKYWLYINGEPVVRDGGLKRGGKEVYYDTLDVSDYLHTGENTIAVRVWYWGPSYNISYVSSGQGGLLFQLNVGEKEIVSDESWLVKRDVAFINGRDESNERLPEKDIWYDASYGEENWFLPEYEATSESGWQNASVLGAAGDEPWGNLTERGIPQFLDEANREYTNVDEMPWQVDASYTTSQDETFTMSLPANIQIYPCLRIEAPAGLEIRIKSDMYENYFGNSVMTTYVTKDGLQEFESPCWTNGDRIFYEIPAGVTIKELTYTKTGYDTEIVGSFSCEDSFYNELWEKSAQSVYVNMRDTYMDCPNRERACWMGDAGLEMLVSFYTMDRNSDALFKSDMEKAIANRYNETVFNTVNPSNSFTNIYVQVLMTIPEVYEYYYYTGDKELLEDIYEPFCEYLTHYEKNEFGLYDYRVDEARWEWGDSTENVDIYPLTNAWLCQCFGTMADMADTLGNGLDAIKFRKKQSDLKESYRKAFWTPNGYKSDGQDVPDERVNAAVVIAQIATEDQYDIIENVLEEQMYSTPFLEFYVEKACCMIGREDLALKRMKNRYACMITSEEGMNHSTLWEWFDNEEGSMNHGWSAGPAVILSKYIAGISPTEVGYTSYEVMPNFCELNHMEATAESPFGLISVEAMLDETTSEETIHLTQPAEITARVAVKKCADNACITLNGKTIDQKGKVIKTDFPDGITVDLDSQDEDCVYFNITGTDVIITSN